jgi:hypothetical protein
MLGTEAASCKGKGTVAAWLPPPLRGMADPASLPLGSMEPLLYQGPPTPL